MKNFILCLLNVAMLVCGQIMFKLGANGKQISSLPDMLRVLFSPYVIAAIAFFAGATVLWVYILTKIPLSFAYPIQALAFPLVLICANFLFGESISAIRWLGVCTVFVGVVLMAR